MTSGAARCLVCGWRGSDPVCPRCGTVVRPDDATCARCKRVLEWPLGWCPCGASEAVRDATSPEVVNRLARIPGLDEPACRRLAAKGFKEPSDVFALALTSVEKRRGVHRAMARGIVLGELVEPAEIQKSVPCPTCGTMREVASEKCVVCGGLPERDVAVEEVLQTLEGVRGEVYNLAEDPDFKRMPEELRDEFVEAFESAGVGTSIPNEYERQFEEWRLRGLDTKELERILHEEGSLEFRARFIPIVRAQIMKHRRGERFLCPVCDRDVGAAANQCGNCGAKFA